MFHLCLKVKNAHLAEWPEQFSTKAFDMLMVEILDLVRNDLICNVTTYLSIKEAKQMQSI